MNEQQAQKLIQMVAELWVDNGGDIEGYDYCIRKIREAIDRLADKGDVHNGRDDLAVNLSP